MIERPMFARISRKGMTIVIVIGCVLYAIPPQSIGKPLPASVTEKKNPLGFLKEIYDEVQALGRHRNERFIKREFHLNLDNNDSNKEEHVLVLNHSFSGPRMMVLQVTYFESKRQNSPVKYAKMIREIECCILDSGVEIRRCDYSTTEIRTLLPNILRGIRETKRYFYSVRQ